MATPQRFDLFGILQILYRHRRFIIIISFISAVVGIGASFMRTKKYNASSEFFLRNPFYADKNFLYNTEARYIDYFATEDEINRLELLAASDNVLNTIISRLQLAAAYKVDTTDPKQAEGLKRSVAGRVKITRTPARSIILSYTDVDAKRAVQITNLYVTLLDEELRNFYNGTRLSMYESILSKLQQEDSTVLVLTDTLVRLREQYGIYDIISPSRSNIIVSSVKYNGKANFAEGLERIQNLESVKDQAVSNRAWHTALASQYTTGTKMNELPLTRIIRTATEPYKASGPGKMLTAIACAFIGFLFSVLYVLMSSYYKSRIS